MMMYRRRSVVVALFGLLTSAAVATPALAETGAVSVVFTKGGFIVGVGGGEGVLTFRGRHYPFTVSGASIGFTVGASTTKLVGKALNRTIALPAPAALLRPEPAACSCRMPTASSCSSAVQRLAWNCRPPWLGLPSP